MTPEHTPAPRSRRRSRTAVPRCGRGELLALGLAAAIAPGMSGCAERPTELERPRVVATVLPLAGIVDRVAGDRVEVIVLIPAGANPVTYEPGLSDLMSASSAALYVEVGHPAFTWERSWVADLIAKSGARRVSAAAGCPIEREDPHVWLSPECARSTARDVAARLREILPDRAGDVEAGLVAFLEEVDAIEEASGRSFAGHRGTAFITLHPAWGYLTRRYGIEQVSILEHGSGDAGPGELAAIISRARSLGLRNVVVQPQFTAEPARLVAAELGGTVVEADPLGRDWAVTMRRIVEVIAREVSG